MEPLADPFFLFGKVITVFCLLPYCEMYDSLEQKFPSWSPPDRLSTNVFIEEKSLTGNQSFINTFSVVAFPLPWWRVIAYDGDHMAGRA